MDNLDISHVFPVDAQTLYDAWLDGRKHSAMTGGEKAEGTAAVGATFTVFGGWAYGENLELEAPTKIVQSWRAKDFPEGAGPSRLTVLLTPQHDGTTVLRLVQTDLPDGTSEAYAKGWHQFYFVPMGKYFRRSAAAAVYGEKPPADAHVAKKAAKKKAAKKKAIAKPKMRAVAKKKTPAKKKKGAAPKLKAKAAAKKKSAAKKPKRAKASAKSRGASRRAGKKR